jgi:hypothetical protein
MNSVCTLLRPYFRSYNSICVSVFFGNSLVGEQLYIQTIWHEMLVTEMKGNPSHSLLKR